MSDEVVFDRERDLAAISRIEAELTAVDEALGRLDAGTYGRCQTCGAAIGDEALAADPLTAGCRAHGG
ncbi:MAG: hypothetical protein M3R71_05015 [Actinomycetota bacterium]|nr:hypothetical protein [Actinomycetota bacterium]